MIQVSMFKKLNLKNDSSITSCSYQISVDPLSAVQLKIFYFGIGIYKQCVFKIT